MPGWKALEEELVRPMSAQEIMAEAGVPNLLEGRKIRLNVFGSMAELADASVAKPSLRGSSSSPKD